MSGSSSSPLVMSQSPSLPSASEASHTLPKLAQNAKFEKKYWADDRHPISQSPSTTVRVCYRKDRSRWAVKTLQKSKVEHWSHLINEVELIQEVQDHPTINPLVDVFEDHKSVHLVSDLCSGGRLSLYVQSTVLDNPSPDYQYHEQEVACIIQQLLRAIEHCHDRDIVHRDLKLDNVLFKKHKNLQVRLIDFDISCKHSSQDEPMTEAVGTKAYMAPEVFDRSYDRKCDIWAIGVMTHALLSGEMPFGGKDDEELVHNIRNKPFAWEAPCWEYISDEAKAFIQLCLERDPTKRPSAEDLLSNDWMGVAATSYKRRSTKKPNLFQRSEFLRNLFSIIEEKCTIRAPVRKLVVPTNEDPMEGTTRTVQLQ
ncbi:unnamed protein product [Cylindrotheca closterium]|uniref:Protein kinase domain-containing protein n=1 Tax=Cylindrotheca closterium TaxID=2856 RepID=A0AAD2FQ28_9STRA|nr:unnamed protein product [Cylindrotheca closterium]